MNKIRTFLELIKFEHTVFALPFAYMGLFVAAGPRPSFGTFFWTTLAMAGARTSGMTLNRLIDRRVDAENPRTKNRALVTGEFSVKSAWIAALAAFGVLLVSAWQLNPLCLKLAPLAAVILAVYHYVKRFSWLCHFSLGLVLSVAPMGGWLAVTGAFSWTPVFLAAAVLFWVAGFDILYSLQDLEFDRAHGLFSVPARFGEGRALKISSYCHVATAAFLVLFGVAAHLGILYWTGVAVAAGLLKVEHSLVPQGDLSNLNAAFFTANGWIGVILLIFTYLELYR